MESFYGAEILSSAASFRLVLQDLSVLCSGLEWLIKHHGLEGYLLTCYAAEHCRLDPQTRDGQMPAGFDSSPLERLRRLAEHAHLEPAALGVPEREWMMVYAAQGFTVLAVARRSAADIEVKVSLEPPTVVHMLTALQSKLSEECSVMRPLQDLLAGQRVKEGLAGQFALKVMERQQSELRAAGKDENRMFRLAEQSLDLIYRIQLKPSFQILYISPIVETWMGCTREQLYQDARISFRHIHPEDGMILKRMMVEENASQGVTVVRFMPSEGEPFWIEHRWFVDRSTDRSVIVLDGVGRDITRQKREEEAISEALRAAEENARSKSLFLANMSHEIRTPLNAIIGQVELLKRSPLNSEQREMLDSVHAAGQILLSHLTDVLDFSRLDAQRVKLQPIHFSLVDALSDALNLVKDAARAKGLTLSRTFGPELPRVVTGDRGKLVQLVLNLLSNAVKFTEKGGVQLKAETQGGDNDVNLLITVSDTGIGFPPEQFQELLQPFSQADASNSRKQEGAGLGLAIVGRLVELLGGTLEVDSEPGKGSVFGVRLGLEAHPGQQNWIRALQKSLEDELRDSSCRFWGTDAFVKSCGLEVELLKRFGLWGERAGALLQLPNDPDGSESGLTVNAPLSPTAFFKFILPGYAVERGQEEASLPADLGILVVEDNEVNRKVIGRQLKTLGLESVDFAHNGEEALHRFDPARHAVVLMDIQMPQLDGVQALEALRKAYPGLKTPVVAITAHALPGDRESYLESGFQSYLSKPVRIEELRKVLQEVTRS